MSTPSSSSRNVTGCNSGLLVQSLKRFLPLNNSGHWMRTKERIWHLNRSGTSWLAKICCCIIPVSLAEARRKCPASSATSARCASRGRDDGVLLPRRQRGGLHAGRLVWRKPTQAALSDTLHNPAYAGAFVYGRKGPHPDRRPGQLRQIRRPMEEWTTIQEASVSCIYHVGPVPGQSSAPGRQRQRFLAAISL